MQYANNIGLIKKRPIIGIIGGSGPDATVDLQVKLLKLMKSRLNAASDQDHYRIIVDNNPEICDRNQALLHKGSSPLAAYIESARALEYMGADVVLLPCNTAHAYYKEIQNSISIKMINMIEETSKFISQHLMHGSMVGLLSTTATNKIGLYQDALTKHGIKVVSPNSHYQKKVTQAIYGIKAGFSRPSEKLSMAERIKLLHVYNHRSSHKNQNISIEKIRSPAQLLQDTIGHLANKKIKNIILGCTEIPLVINNDCSKEGLGLIDPTQILAQKAIDLILLIEREIEGKK